MGGRGWYFLVAVCLGGIAPTVSVSADEPVPGATPDGLPDVVDVSGVVVDRIVVRVGPSAMTAGAAADGLTNEVSALGAELVAESSVVPGYKVLRVPAGTDVTAAVARLASLPGVEYAAPDGIVQLQDTVPNDPSFPSLWGMTNIRAPLAWDRTTGDPSVVVAIIDTGISYNHPDLAANIWSNPGEIAGNGIDDDANGYVDDIRGWDFHYGDNNPSDVHGHGTHTAGTVGAVGNNGIGVVGVNWNVKMVALKVLGDSGSGYWSSVALAIEYATQMGFSVSNNSYGGYYADPWVRDALAASAAAGQVFVAAAGNSSVNADRSPMYPAAFGFENIISVAAIDSANNRASFSNYGPLSVDLGAPGVGVLSTYKANGYASLSGTSMASPHVAGAVALLQGLHPDWSVERIKNRLLATARPIPALTGLVVSSGTLDLGAAIQELVCTINGSPSDDNIVGTAGDDVICAGAGNDTIDGGGGNDRILPGPGNDTVNGGSGDNSIGFDDSPVGVVANLAVGTASGEGNDTFINIQDLDGSALDDQLTGSSGRNTIRGFAGDDTIVAGGDADLVVAGLGDDIVLGGAGVDTLRGGLGNDSLSGEASGDTLDGGEGDDTLNGGPSNDTFDGGLGIDLADFAAASTSMVVDLTAGTATGEGSDSVAGIENVTTGSGNDVLTGDAEPNVLNGGGGGDQLNGLLGDDTLLGGAGGDTLAGGDGVDTASFENAATPLTINLAAGTASGEGADTLNAIENAIGGSNNDTINGSSVPNRLDGRAGTDTVTGAGGDDVVLGGEGNDTLDGGPGADTLSFEGAVAGVTASLQSGTATGQGNDTATLFENINGTGNDDTLTGDDLPNAIEGFAGDDVIDGRGGSDPLLRGGVGNDTVLGGTGNDVLRGGTGDDQLSGMAGNDTLDGFENDDDLLEDDDLCVQGSGTGTPANCERTLLPVSVTDVVVTEGDTGTVNAVFTMSVPIATDLVTTVSARTVAGTAVSGSDFVARAASPASIGALATSTTVTIAVNGDTLDEPDETFDVALASPSSHATILDANGLGTIVDDDEPAALPTLSIADVSVLESNAASKTVTLTVVADQPLPAAASVRYATAAGGTATAGVDYATKAPTNLTIPGGATSKTFTLTVKGDVVVEPNETFLAVLSNPSGATIGDGSATVTIIDDDAAPQLAVADASVVEGDAGTRLLSFTLQLDRASGRTVSAKYRTSNGTAVAPSDYTAKALTLVSFTAGQTSKVVSITIKGDLTIETNETFSLVLSNPSNLVIVDATAIGTIQNDDP